MKISGVAFIGYPITDVVRSRYFYEKILELTPAVAEQYTKPHSKQKIWWIEYDINGVAFALSDGWPHTGSGPTVALEVDNLNNWLDKLQEFNVPISTGPVNMPICRYFVCSDPDHNDLMFFQRKVT